MKVILLVGVPCSGKSYVCSQLARLYQVVPHDTYKDRADYVDAILDAVKRGTVLAEAPFNAAQLRVTLENAGTEVEEWLVTDSLFTIAKRYMERTGKPYPANFATNHGRYLATPERFMFSGPSQDVVTMLRRFA